MSHVCSFSPKTHTHTVTQKADENWPKKKKKKKIMAFYKGPLGFVTKLKTCKVHITNEFYETFHFERNSAKPN